MRSWERGRGWQSHSPSPHGSPIVGLGSQVHGALGGQSGNRVGGRAILGQHVIWFKSTRELGIQRA